MWKHISLWVIFGVFDRKKNHFEPTNSQNYSRKKPKSGKPRQAPFRSPFYHTNCSWWLPVNPKCKWWFWAIGWGFWPKIVVFGHCRPFGLKMTPELPPKRVRGCSQMTSAFFGVSDTPWCLCQPIISFWHAPWCFKLMTSFVNSPEPKWSFLESSLFP